MARIRTIKPEFWTDAIMVQLPPLARLLYIGLWNFADDHGRIGDEPERISMEVMPREDHGEVACLLDLLVATGRLSRMVLEDGSSYLQIEKWADHQKVDHPSKSKFPRESSRKLAIPAEARRIVAKKYSCAPGGEVDADCYVCGAPGLITWHRLRNGKPSYWVSFSGLEIDHFEEEANGGATSAENLVLTCRSCNRSRGTKQMPQFVIEKLAFEKPREASRDFVVGKERKGSVSDLPESFSSTTRAAKGAGQALEAPPAFPPALPPVDRVLIAAGLLDKVLNPRAIEAARRTVERWEAAGWSVDLDIIPTVAEQSKRMAAEGDPPRSVAVFEKWICAAHAKRLGAPKTDGDEEEAKLKAMTKPERIAHNHQRIARMRGHNTETERGLRTAMLEILRNEDFYGMTDRPEECDTVIPTAWLADHFADPRTLLQIEAAGIVRYDRLKAFCERAGLPDSLAEAREKHGAYLASLTGEEYLDVDEDSPPITGGHSQAA